MVRLGQARETEWLPAGETRAGKVFSNKQQKNLDKSNYLLSLPSPSKCSVDER